MIANSSGNKLKASKGFKESDGVKLLVSEDKRALDRGEGDKERVSLGENSSSKSSYTNSTVYSNSRDRSFKPRPRHRDDFRISRNPTERRGGSSRGRGIPHRKMEKEGDIYVSRGKFQESLIKGKTSDGLPSMSFNKYTTDIEGGKSKSVDYGNYPGLPEDSRISKVLRRMSREDDPDKFIAYCNQLQEAIVAVDNARYIRRATDLICESLLDMLHSGPNSNAKLQAAKCLGRLGHTLEQDFKKFMEWVFSNYSVERNDDVKTLLLNAVLETVHLEQDHPQLKEFISPLMQHLHQTLESVDKAQHLLVTVEVILDLASLYPDAFTKYFKDTVDILVGWHIDLTTPPGVACYASQSLQRLTHYWANHIEFSLTMLGHFLEDQEVTFEDFLEAHNSSNSPGDEQHTVAQEQRMKLISFMKVFNTVVKGLGQSLSPNMTPEVSWTFLTDCLARILAILLKGLKTLLDFELFITGNECTWLLLNLLQNKTCPAHEDLYQLIDLEISLMEQLTNTALSSTLQLIAKVIKELSANLPLDLVERVLKPDSPFLQLRFSPCRSVHNGIVAIYHSLLSLKNIPLLKEAYRLIMTDLDTVYRVLVPELEPLCAGIEDSDRVIYTPEQVESVIIFHLKALTDIANASNSLIGMWVLQPSILDLLAVRLIPFSIGRVSSPLLFTQLYLLFSHCSRHSHFITTSNLVGGCQGRPGVNSLVDTTQASPTAGHFLIIISLLASLVNEELYEESTCLVLNWCCELLIQCRPYLKTLAETPEMTRLAYALCRASTYLHSDNILLAICINLENLLIPPYTLCWKKKVLEQIADVCLLHVNSNNADVANRFSSLMLQLPWTVVIPSLQQGNVKKGSARKKIESAVHTQMTHDANTGEMSPHRFKQFMAYLLHGNKSDLQELFTCCWSLSESEPHDLNSLREICLASQQALYHWATWESAQFCVNTKLRTPFGKPLDTFMAFEGAMKCLARETVGSVRAEVGEEFDVCRVHLLLEVVEQLEKCMYNASDGTAAVLVSPSKPVRTFFHTNKSTCNEWLSRNRSAVVGVASHCGMAAMAVRHGHALLQDLLDAGNVKGSEFENAVLQVGWALLKLKEPEAVQGLYVWCRDVVGVKYHYLKAFAEHAAGKLEMAVEMYIKLMKNESVESLVNKKSSLPTENSELLGHNAKDLVADQITECYLALQDWTQLAEWKNEEIELLTNQNGGTSIKYKFVTARSAKGLAEYEKGDLAAACELLEWTTELPEDKRPTWDCYQLLGSTRHKLANIVVRSIASGIIHDEDREILHECQAAAHCYLLEGLRNTPSEVVQEAAILEFAANALLSQHEIFIDGPEEMVKDKKKESDSVLLSRILWWGQALEKLAISSQPSPQLSLDAAKMARKEGNLNLALRQLSYHLNQILQHDNGHRTQLVLTDNILVDMDNVPSPWSLPQAQAFSELSKLLHSVGNVELAVAVGSTAAVQIADVEDQPVREICSRLLLSLAQWIPLLESSAVPDSVQLLINWQQRKVIDNSNLLDIANFDPEGDTVGTILHLAVSHYPELAKAWVGLAGWAFRWGRKATDQVLTPVDKDYIATLIPDTVDKESVYSILTRTTPPLEDDDIEVENMSQSETVEWELQRLNVFTAEQLAALVEMWRKSHARTYNFYQLSAHSYFKYLQLCTDPQDDSDAITACLRLLRLIVKHAEELQSVLEVGLSMTPSLPWVCIIPQLFSRLSHPQPYVRRRVSELLCRLAADKPHLIIFPSVVGSDAGAQTIRDMPRTKLFSNNTREVEEDLVIEDEEEEEFEEEEEDESHDGEESQAMENCFQAMVDILSKQDGDGIAQVQVFVRELRRITLLWDELWLGTLQQHHSYMSRRVQCLEQEVSRVDDNPHLSASEKDRLVAENHRVILKPLLFVLEQLYAITSVTAETPHETWFQEKFGSNITEVLEKLRRPSDPRKPSEAWSALKGLQVKLQQRANKRASYSLRMKDVSPTLAGMRNTQISMPGMKSVLTIAGIHDHIAVLPTKTKPKKLVFQGSDGKMYTYLFKGLEDLHLDERIMQFLSIANTMLRDSITAPLQACHYAVIPLGLRSGLISWVEGVTPLFSLYKRWQQRQANINQSSVMRPSELFYSKLTPLLKDCEVAKPESRLEWPLPVLKQVLTELMQETPTYLLSRELWCDSVNAGGWWQSTKLFSTSLAVMSIIGYIIGLGDRHLDNVLVDLTSGQVVHIDYNVCFEKGKSLRVPEKVPFRLTPNLRAALGVTGVEGLFRLTCEHVLKVMKKGRETVLTLLEAFVYDPLIDWTPGSETGYTGAVYGGGRAVALESKQSRKQLEREVTTAMLAIRLAEMKYDWLDNRDKLLVALPELAAVMELWLGHKAAVKCAEEVLQERHQLMALVKEAEAHGPEHQLFNLTARHRANVTATEASTNARTKLQARVDDCVRQQQQYNVALCYFYGAQMSQWVSEVNSRTNQDNYMVFDLIKEFLQNAGQGQMVSQCSQSEKELSELCNQQTQLTRACLDMLGQYGAIVRQFPVSHIGQHRSSLYQRWSVALLEAPYVESCELVLKDMQKELSTPKMSLASSIVGFNMGLQRLLAESRVKLAERSEAAELAKQAPADVDKAVDRLRGQNKVAVSGVVLTALVELNKRSLMMESAAKSARECLVDLTSQKGDWFFDDLCLSTNTANQLLSLLPPPDPDSPLHNAVKCVDVVHKQFKTLQELNVNFSSIILPEAIQTIQREDLSVLTLIAELDAIVTSLHMPLSELVAQLQLHLHYCLVGMGSPQNVSVEKAQGLQQAVEAMFQRLSAGETLTPGQMLFMGFNGLFDNLTLGNASLVSAVSSLNPPAAWKSVDQLRDAKLLTTPLYDQTARSVLDSIFLVKRLQAMQELFALCRANAEAFQGISVGLPYDDDRFNRPIRCFTADYVSSQLLGVFSYTLAVTLCFLMQQMGLNVTGEVEQREVGADSRVSLQELGRATIALCIRQKLIPSSNTLRETSGVVMTVETGWRAQVVTSRAMQELKRAEVTLQRLQLQLTAHCWLHEDILAHSQVNMHPPPLGRSTFMVDLRKTSTALMSLQPRLMEGIEQQNALISSAEQRLKWAAGANPALAEVMCAFETAVKNNNDQLLLEQSLGTLVANICNTVLWYEALRTRTNEALTNDAAFLQLVEEMRQSCLLYQTLNTQMSSLEESLVKLCPPETQVDYNWITKAVLAISESVKKLLEEMEPLRSQLFAAYDAVKSEAAVLRSLLVTHYRTMSDVRSLLKTMVKFDEPGVAEYLTNYRAYTERVTVLIKTIEGLDEFTPDRLQMLLQEIAVVECETPGIYEDLLRLSTPEGEASNKTSNKRPPLLRQDTVCVSPKRDPHTGKAVQERNAYALSVWRRVRLKLEGKDPDISRKYNVQEQVDWCINEATCLDNLALLYEGWTPWV